MFLHVRMFYISAKKNKADFNKFNLRKLKENPKDVFRKGRGVVGIITSDTDMVMLICR